MSEAVEFIPFFCFTVLIGLSYYLLAQVINLTHKYNEAERTLRCFRFYAKNYDALLISKGEVLRRVIQETEPHKKGE